MSARKNVLLPFALIDGVSMGASITSNPVNAQFQDNIGLQIEWASSDAVGTIAIECSNDCKLNTDGTLLSGTFYALTFDPALTQPNSDNGGYLVSLNQLPYAWYRVTYTRTSGTGTLSVITTSKAV